MPIAATELNSLKLIVCSMNFTSIKKERKVTWRQPGGYGERNGERRDGTTRIKLWPITRNLLVLFGQQLANKI